MEDLDYNFQYSFGTLLQSPGIHGALGTALSVPLALGVTGFWLSLWSNLLPTGLKPGAPRVLKRALLSDLLRT